LKGLSILTTVIQSMTKLKILFVIPEYSHGGTNKSLENLLSLLDKDIYEINIYSLFEDGGDYYKDVFKQYIIKKSRLYYWLHDNFVTRKFMGLYNRITKRNNFTWLYKREANIIQSKYHFDTIVAYQEGSATSFVSYVNEPINKVAWYHCPYVRFNKVNKSKALKLYSQFNSIACVSNCFVELFSEQFPTLRNKVYCIYNTLNCDLITKMGNESISGDLFNHDYFNIVSVGRFAKQKQFEKIPLIAKRIKELTNRPFKWYIIASGYACKAETVFNIGKYNVEKNVILLGPKDNPYPYFKSADLYVCTSDSESFSYTIFESKILHTPVLSNNFPVAYEVLDNDCGWVCPMDEMPSLLSDIINDNGGTYSQVKKSIKNYNYDNKNIIKIVESIIN
jgi:glycosyltransferase involved in cell wall biosynthesis